MKSKYILFLAVYLYTFNVCGQSMKDTSYLLSPEHLLAILRNYHPVIKQAAIQVDISKTEILENRAAFDPTLSGKMSGKNLKGEDYYQSKELGVEVPTWYGLDFEAGWTNYEGQRLDNEITQGNSSYIGVSIPILINLVYDKRRGFLEQAKALNRLSIQEQRKIVNDIVLEAMKSYWDWVKAYESFKILDEAVENNLQRLKFVQKSILFGERPSIDSIEANTQLISFQIEKENRWTQFLNASNDLSIYMWMEENRPYILPKSAKPTRHWDNKYRSEILSLNLENIKEEGIKNHPEIKMYEEQIGVYRIQKKIYFQDLLPKLDFNYRIITSNSPDNFQINDTRFLTNNYQYSLKLDVPLRISQGRANFKMAKLKINYGELALEQKIQAVSLKINSYINNYLNYESLGRKQRENYENYRIMVKAEETRFQNGESNLFTINARELKALEALDKLIDLKTKYFKSIYELKWSAGILR